MSHGGEDNTKAITLLLAVRISHFGNFGSTGTVSFCAVVLQAVVPGVMRLCVFKIRYMDMTADKRWKN